MHEFFSFCLTVCLSILCIVCLECLSSIPIQAISKDSKKVQDSTILKKEKYSREKQVIQLSKVCEDNFDKSRRKLKWKIKIITRKTTLIRLDERIQNLNRLMVGWVNYFKHATGYQKLKELDSWVRCRLRYCIWKQWKKPKRRLRAFRQLGIVESWARRFAYSRRGGWFIACSPIMGTTVTEDRLRQRGYIPFLECYLKAKFGDDYRGYAQRN